MPSEKVEKIDIKEVKHQYCYATDALDAERLVDTFVADGRFEIGRFEAGSGRGHDDLREYLEWFAEQDYEVRAHNVFNPIIEVDGDKAHGEWYYLVAYDLPDDDLEVGHGRYRNDFIRKEDGWKIADLTAQRRITKVLQAHTPD